MLREEEAKEFIKKLNKEKKERETKITNIKVNEFKSLNKEIKSRKDYYLIAKERLKEQRNDMSMLNKDFIQFQKQREYFDLASSTKIKPKSIIKKDYKNNQNNQNNQFDNTLMFSYNDLTNQNQNNNSIVSLYDNNLKLKIHNNAKTIQSNRQIQKEVYPERDILIREIKAKYFNEINNN